MSTNFVSNLEITQPLQGQIHTKKIPYASWIQCPIHKPTNDSAIVLSAPQVRLFHHARLVYP